MNDVEKTREDGFKTVIAGYIDHLESTAKTFNNHAREHKLPVTMHPEKAIAAIKSGVGIADVASTWGQSDDGVVHETQIVTAIECIIKMLEQPGKCGHVLGAMQSGKTTTSLALQWAGPIIYLLTSNRIHPFYIISSQTSHEDQTRIELQRFLTYYGHVEFRANPTRSDIDPMFEASSSLNTYRVHVLRSAQQDVLEVPQLDQLVHRRVGGDRALKKIAEMCGTVATEGNKSLMIIDEPQFGASDHIVNGKEGAIQHKCVLAQIFERIETELGPAHKQHWFIGLSATPFELNDLKNVWQVRQSLTEAYSGFNFFAEEPISPDVNVTPPTTMSLSNFASYIDVPFMKKVLMAAYDSDKAKSFRGNAKKIQYDGDQQGYQRDMEDALREAIYALLEKYKTEDTWPVGLCIRAFNNNTKTKALISGLNLDPDRVEVIVYYGSEAAGMSIKRAIARRTRKDLPYVIFVTNRARMADAFPKEVRFFMDFAQKASDLNSLLQGLLGRACGYGKRSTVVLSDASAGIVDAYVATQGGYVHKTSRHSVTVGGHRRGAPSGMIKVRDTMNDPDVRAFFERINREVVAANIPDGTEKMKVKRAKGGENRRGPILRIAEEIGLFDHLEDPKVRTLLFPHIPSGFKIARKNDQVQHSHRAGVNIGYSLDEEDNCRYTFRWSDRAAGAQGGAAGRAKGKRDASQHMEPTIYVEKYDPATGNTIQDKDASEKRPGNWRAFMVTFPLCQPVQEIKTADVAYPIKTSPYDNWMAEDERVVRDTKNSS